jgi:hypothetical protein
VYARVSEYAVPPEGGSMDHGTSVVDGRTAPWTLNYYSATLPSTSPNGVASEYPNYMGSVTLDVCVEDTKLVAEYGVVSSLSGGPHKNPPNSITANYNAAVPEAREEIHSKLRQRYEEYFGAMKEFLESIDSGSWLGRTDLSGIPTTIEGHDDLLNDPFQGKLGDSGSGAPEPSTNSSPASESTADLSNDTSPPAASTGSPESTSSNKYPWGLYPEGEDQVREAVEQYYYAVDYEEWAYTYYNLDSESKALFTEEEWTQKNQWYADNEQLKLDSMSIHVTMEGEEAAKVTVYRIFTDGSSITRETYFVWDNGWWKHHLTEEEKEIFMPGVSYEEFVKAQEGGA